MFTIRSLHVSMEIWGSILCFIMAICLFLGRSVNSQKRKVLILIQIFTVILLVSDAFAWGFRGNPGMIGYYMVRISNFLVFIMCDVIFVSFHAYLCCCLFGSYNLNDRDDIKKSVKIRNYAVYITGTIGISFVIISQFAHLYYYFDENNFYHRNTLHFLCLLIPLVGMIIDATLMIEYRKNVKRETMLALCSYLILPVLATLVSFILYGISLINISINISAVFMFVTASIEQGRELTQKEKEMYNLRTEVLISQIGPHFIYNTLTTIKHLCKTNPVEAAKTVDEFSVYLRGNIDSLSQKKNIIFEQELNHVKNYLAIEKKRFGDRINVVYDIKENDFFIPALTLQPVVENALKHGILKKEDGGNVYISTKKDDNYYIIEVDDDGIGYDEENYKNDGRNHVGIINIKNRIKNMCNGTLEIYGEKNKGTRVVIKIPV